MPKAVCVLLGEVKGTVYFQQAVSSYIKIIFFPLDTYCGTFSKIHLIERDKWI
jgi:hypothetical protein